MTQGRSNSWRHSRCWSPNQRQGPGCRGHTLRRWPRRGVGAPHLRGMQDGPVSPARCVDCANLRWRAGRFRRHVAGDMPLSDSVAVVASRETDRPSPSCAAGCGAGDIGVCCLYSGLFASASADIQDRHTGVCARPAYALLPPQTAADTVPYLHPKTAPKSSVGCGIKASFLRREHRGLLGDAAMSNPPVLPAPPASGWYQFFNRLLHSRNSARPGMHRRVTLPVLLRL